MFDNQQAREKRLEDLKEICPFTSRDTHAFLGISEQTMKALIETGKLPGTKVEHGKVKRDSLFFYLSESAFEDFVSNKEVNLDNFNYNDYFLTVRTSACVYAKINNLGHYVVNTLNLDNEYIDLVNQIVDIFKDQILNAPEIFLNTTKEDILTEFNTDASYESLPLISNLNDEQFRNLLNLIVEGKNLPFYVIGIKQDYFDNKDILEGDYKISNFPHEKTMDEFDFYVDVGDGIPFNMINACKEFRTIQEALEYTKSLAADN